MFPQLCLGSWLLRQPGSQNSYDDSINDRHCPHLMFMFLVAITLPCFTATAHGWLFDYSQIKEVFTLTD
jgi:hypothetical protein